MQDKIINHISESYNPDAIILHGSRARQKERKHSDWDLILLFNQPTNIKSGREFFEGQNIEYSVHNLPIDDIFDVFGTKLQKAIIIFEKNGEGSSLLNEAIIYYEQGVQWPQEKIDSHQLWVEGRIQGMVDSVESPLVFHKYFTDFYSRVYNYWYWLKQKQHSQPIYIATDEIAEKDPAFYKLLLSLFENNPALSARVDVCQKISNHLFG